MKSQASNIYTPNRHEYSNIFFLLQIFSRQQRNQQVAPSKCVLIKSFKWNIGQDLQYSTKRYFQCVSFSTNQFSIDKHGITGDGFERRPHVRAVRWRSPNWCLRRYQWCGHPQILRRGEGAGRRLICLLPPVYPEWKSPYSLMRPTRVVDPRVWRHNRSHSLITLAIVRSQSISIRMVTYICHSNLFFCCNEAQRGTCVLI